MTRIVRAAARAIAVVVSIVAALMVTSALPDWVSPEARDGPPGAVGPRLSLSVMTDKALLSANESLGISVTVRNSGQERTWLPFPTSCHASFTVSGEDGSIVYNQSLHDGCLPLASRLALGPGEAANFEFAWDQARDDSRAVLGGRSYRIDAALLTSDASSRLSAETTVAIEPGAGTVTFSFEARTDRDRYAPGDLANVTVVLTNTGTATAHIVVPDSCDFGFYVLDRYGSVVYSEPYDETYGCEMVISSFTLAPGASKVERFIWDLRTSNGAVLAPGWYAVYPALVHAEVNPDDITDVGIAVFYMSP